MAHQCSQTAPLLWHDSETPRMSSIQNWCSVQTWQLRQQIECSFVLVVFGRGVGIHLLFCKISAPLHRTLQNLPRSIAAHTHPTQLQLNVSQTLSLSNQRGSPPPLWLSQTSRTDNYSEGLMCVCMCVWICLLKAIGKITMKNWLEVFVWHIFIEAEQGTITP